MRPDAARSGRTGNSTIITIARYKVTVHALGNLYNFRLVRKFEQRWLCRRFAKVSP